MRRALGPAPIFLKPDSTDPPSHPVMKHAEAAAPVSDRATPSADPVAGAGAVDDPVLVARARAGDEAAFRILVERHQDRAFGLALRMLRSRDDAREVAQEAFVRAWLAIGRFRGDASFSTWLHAIVTRRALDRAEVLKKRRTREMPGENAPEVAAPTGAGPEQRALALRLERLLATLSGPQRAAVTLFYYEGHGVEQIAAMLGMPEGTVKTHLSRARAALRAGWQREAGE